MRTSAVPISILLVLVLFLTVVPLGAEAGYSSPAVHFTRICPSYPGEFVTMTNDGPEVDLCGWRLSDGEGSVMIGTSFNLSAHQSVSWCESPERFLAFYPNEAVMHKNTSGLSFKGSLKLADQGDELMLYDASGALVDVLHYGDSEPLSPWTGPAVPCRKGEMLVRTVTEIGFSSWRAERPGVYTVRSVPMDATVTPILYPDDGLSAMVREIDRTEKSIHMAAYLIENWTLARHLCSAAARGVQVTLLLEGQPVGGVSENGAAIAYYLQDAGAEVWIMRSRDSFRRYDYLHAKYLVFDRERLLVSSENMADSSFSTNRGWAVLVGSEALSQAALEIFQRDLSGRNVDVFPLELSLSRNEGGPGRLLTYGAEDIGPRYQATASLISSPFLVREVVLAKLQGAERRICLQQMSIDEGWLQDGVLMEAVYDAAERGISVRILLDNGLGTAVSNLRITSSLNVMAFENGWDLECRMTSDGSPFERMHNKGVIVDDTVLVGSANWVDGSMERNREMMVMLESSDMTSVYLDWFMDDWRGDSLPPVIDLPWHYIESRNGEMVLLDATNCHDPSGIAEFNWDLDGDGLADLFGPLQTIALPMGEHNITLTVTDPLGNGASETLTVLVVPGAGAFPSLLLYAPVPMLALLLFFKRLKRRIY
ncbi:MAG: phospholipase D-like domain-containing protein [Methanomassiliicoccales archaeon]|nr:phospholipase D-like domain-containing protein [Methanomassiliicoccales archaeon]